MATTTVPSLLQSLGQHRLLTSTQVQDVKRQESRFQDTKALLQDLQRRGWLTGYQCQQVAQGKSAELVLGSYRLLARLGEGASGQVFKAHDERSGLLVALKVLRREMQGDAELVGRFTREMDVAGKVLHPNVVRAYEAATIGSSLVLAMEYVEGTDLDKLVKESGPLPAARAADFTRQAALGLQHAHERGLVHRDIKPANLLLSREGLVKVLDLGLARLLEPERHRSSSNLTIVSGNQVTIGTPDYLAPEQALDLHSADIRADVYSLGCTFFYLLTGQPPFPGGTLAEKLMRHQMAEPRAVSQVRPGLPTALDRIVFKMLAKKPSDRYQTPGEVARVLAEAFPSAAAARTAVRPVAGTRLRPIGGLPRSVRWAAGLLLVGLLLGGVWLMLPRGNDGQTKEEKPGVAASTAPTVTLPRPPRPTTAATVEASLSLVGRNFVRDALIDFQKPGSRLGSVSGNNEIIRGAQSTAFLVRFDLAKAGIPAGAKVRQATVSFFVWDPHSHAKSKVCAFPMKTEWDEATVTWNQPAEGKTWQGGGPFSLADIGPAGQHVVVLPDAPGSDTAEPPIEYQINVSRMVQGWLDGTLPNHGLALATVSDRAVDNGNQTRFQIFASEHPRPQYTPKLTVSWQQ